jgi:hypothetical protein
LRGDCAHYRIPTVRCVAAARNHALASVLKAQSSMMTAMLVWNALCSTSMPENLKWRNVG